MSRAPAGAAAAAAAVRAVVRGEVQGVGFRDATVQRAREAGVLGWVRNDEEDGGGGGVVRVHAEGSAEAVEELLAFLRTGPPAAQVAGVEVERVRAEGHEQFAIRGVSAGAFVVEQRTTAAGSPRFELRLEVDGALRAWTLPKGPSMDPAVKRLAVQVEDDDHDAGRRASTTATSESAHGDGRAWDQGTYEQGGRVPWPEALERGHAVFVLHGEILRGGFALQRTGRPGQWLLIKRRDDEARPGSDVTAG